VSFDAFALPALDGIPARYAVGGAPSFGRALGLALLDNDLVDKADVRRRPPSDAAFCYTTLKRHWDEITRGLSIFDWNLAIEENPFGCGRAWHDGALQYPGKVWAHIKTPDGPVSCATVCVGGAVRYLEGLQRGFGQTILSALYDVLNLLPRVWTTDTMISIGQYIYWNGCVREKDAIQEAMAFNDCATEQELMENHEFVTRRQLFGNMPQWAARPQRRLPRRMIDQVAAYDGFASMVVNAMDELWTALQFCGPFPDLRSNETYGELLDLALIVRWDDDDSTGRIVDDYLQYSGEGDYIGAGAVCGIELDDRSLSRWLDGMRSAAILAQAAERVLDLLGSREYEEQRLLVRVMV
jgi:PRTRC genetic system protein F